MKKINEIYPNKAIYLPNSLIKKNIKINYIKEHYHLIKIDLYWEQWVD